MFSLSCLVCIHLASLSRFRLTPHGSETHHGRAKEDTIVHAEAKDPTNGITKAHARELTKQFAYFLRHEYGVGADGPGKDVVVTVSSGQSALACLFFGVVAADGVYSAASPMNTASDLTRQIKDGPGKVIICSDDVKETALSAAKAAGLPARNVLVLESHPNIKLTSVDESAACDFKHTLDWRVITNTHELEHSKVCVLYSSGTTGLPKGTYKLCPVAETPCYLQLDHRSIGFSSKPCLGSISGPSRHKSLL